MKKQFNQMNRQQSAYGNAADHQTDSDHTSYTNGNDNHRTTSGKKGAKEDYIDFEEIPASKR